MEAGDLGTYVVKFRGAGQGPAALVAAVVSGELARALDPSADPGAIDRALHAAADVCAAASGADPAGLEDVGRRFRWLTAPRSTVVQPGPVQNGLTTDPDGDLERLLGAAGPTGAGVLATSSTGCRDHRAAGTR